MTKGSKLKKGVEEWVFFNTFRVYLNSNNTVVADYCSISSNFWSIPFSVTEIPSFIHRGMGASFR